MNEHKQRKNGKTAQQQQQQNVHIIYQLMGVLSMIHRRTIKRRDYERRHNHNTKQCTDMYTLHVFVYIKKDDIFIYTVGYKKVIVLSECECIFATEWMNETKRYDIECRFRQQNRLWVVQKIGSAHENKITLRCAHAHTHTKWNVWSFVCLARGDCLTRLLSNSIAKRKTAVIKFFCVHVRVRRTTWYYKREVPIFLACEMRHSSLYCVFTAHSDLY